MPTFYGNPSISELQPRRIHRPNSGWSTERRFRGVVHALNGEAAAILAANSGVEIQIDPPQDDIGEGVMTVRVPDAQDGSDAAAGERVVWGCPNSTRERLLTDSPKYDAFAYTYPSGIKTLTALGDVVAKAITGEDIPTEEVINSGYSDDPRLFLLSIKAGERQYMSSVFTLRRSSNAPSGWTVPNLQQYVDVVFTRAQIISLFSPPANIVTQMPTSPEGEYLCIRAELEQTEKGGWQTVMEWAHMGAWSFIYTRWT